MSTVNLVWITPNAEQLLGYIARVSNPQGQDNPNVSRLLSYMIRNEHWSPFEMASMCVEIETTRDIARQILRHRSFSFQEFSQRYADASTLGEFVTREARLQDTKNRQNSTPVHDIMLADWWHEQQRRLGERALETYEEALERGIAKEVARAVLPEGMTPSKLYMTGTVRSWMHYLKSRTDPSTQKEHRDVASDIMSIFKTQLPTVHDAYFEAPQRRVHDLRTRLDAASGENLDPHTMHEIADELLTDLEG